MGGAGGAGAEGGAEDRISDPCFATAVYPPALPLHTQQPFLLTLGYVHIQSLIALGPVAILPLPLDLSPNPRFCMFL